jgi:hypothetical protein
MILFAIRKSFPFTDPAGIQFVHWGQSAVSFSGGHDLRKLPEGRNEEIPLPCTAEWNRPHPHRLEIGVKSVENDK